MICAALCSITHAQQELQGIRDYHTWSLEGGDDSFIQPDIDSMSSGSGRAPIAPPRAAPTHAAPAPEIPAPAPPTPAATNEPWEKALLDDSAVVAEYKALVRAQWRRDGQVLQERARAFAWQYSTTEIMFWVVHAFLVIAMIAAVMEFVAAYRKRNEAPTVERTIQQRAQRVQHAAQARAVGAPADTEPAREPETELKLGMEGLALKTALNGLLILAMAMGFYFLYLKFVYPITEVGLRAPAVAAAET